jgi:hypothetical protein
MSEDRRSDPLHGVVARTVTTFMRYPNADPRALLAALEREVGVSASMAWKLYQMVPIAACHVVMRDAGPKFPPEYLVVRRGRWMSGAERRAWADEPIYRATVEVVEHAEDHDLSDDQLLATVWYSAEMNGITQLRTEGGDISDLVLAETVLFDFEEAGSPGLRRLTDWLSRVLIPVRGAFRPSHWRR